MKSNNKFNWKNITMYIIIGVAILSFVIVGIPFLADFLEKVKFFGFTKGELLEYSGVLFGGAITFIILKMTNKNNNESLNKQIETQKDVMKKQFEFELKEKQVKDLEVGLKNILNKCRISEDAIYSFNMIPKYLSEITVKNIMNSFSNPLINLKNSIDKLITITNIEFDNFRLVTDSFIIDDIISSSKYIRYKDTILQYLNAYISTLQDLNRTINDMIDLVNKIYSRDQLNNQNIMSSDCKEIIKYNFVSEDERAKFANLKTNLDYYIGSHNAFKIRGWANISSEIGEFIKFLNKQIVITDDEIKKVT